MLLVSGKEMAVQKLPSLLMPPIKERPFPYYSSEPRNSKVQPWQFKTKQTSLALLPTNSWIILIRSTRNRWKLGGLHLEEGKMFCFTFFCPFWVCPSLYIIFFESIISFVNLTRSLSFIGFQQCTMNNLVIKAFLKNRDLSLWSFQALQAQVEGAQVWTHCGLAVWVGTSYVSEIGLKVWSKMLSNYHLFEVFSMQMSSFFLWQEV